MAKQPSAKQLAARRAFAARYGGKSRRSGRKATGTTTVARRFARTRRYASAARRGVSRSRSAGGRASPLIDGALAGIAAPFANKFLGSWGTPATLVGVGMFRRNPTLTTLGAFTAAANLTAGTGFMGVTPQTGGWL